MWYHLSLPSLLKVDRLEVCRGDPGLVPPAFRANSCGTARDKLSLVLSPYSFSGRVKLAHRRILFLVLERSERYRLLQPMGFPTAAQLGSWAMRVWSLHHEIMKFRCCFFTPCWIDLLQTGHHEQR